MNKKISVLDIAYIGVSVALIAICSWISIPFAVPFTLQTFAVFAIAIILGGLRGSIAVLVYLLLGAIGVPVFAGFSGGAGVLFGSTGGYLFGFFFITVITGVLTHFFGKKIYIEIIGLVLGLAVCYLFGTLWFYFVYARTNGAVGIATVLGWCVLPFIIPDLCKLAIALIVGRRVRPLLKLQASN